MDQSTKRDFLNIMKLSLRKDIQQEEVLNGIIKISETTNNFHSSIGKVFIDRIKQILSNKEASYKCIICKNNTALNGIVCESCTNIYVNHINKVKLNEEKKATDVNKKNEALFDEKIKSVNNNTDKSVINKNSVSGTNDNKQQCAKQIYRTSILGTFMYKITGIINKKELKKKQKDNPQYQEPISGHVFIGLFTILFLAFYLFSLYAGGIMLCIGISILIYKLIKLISQFKMDSLLLIILSIIFWPLGLILLVLGIFKKIGYIYQNRKYIGAGFVLYGMIAFISATMYDIPGHFCSPGIVGYLEMIFAGEYGTRWATDTLSALIEMIIFIVAGIITTYFIIGGMAVYLDEVEEYCFSNGLSVKQAFVKILQSPIDVLLMFIPLILFILCKTEMLENNWSLDIDNNTHDVSEYMRFRNGKWEHVNACKRRNPDDIINNNLSYKGDRPYNGHNPIRNDQSK